ncbi:MAG: DUF3991 and toprim domain-containing protein [Clostridiales bacterium]|nr:DUF3991 and toprim domain-containing protein [Clostridiales bacterium]
MIDTKEVEQARNTDIIAFLERRCGFAFAHRGGAYRCNQHPSLAVKDDRRSWYWHSKGVGGYGALDYLIKAENLSFREAVVSAGSCSGIASAPEPRPQEKTLVLPEKSVFHQGRVYSYLYNKRGIDSRIISSLIQEGKLYGDIRGNVVFVGFDEHCRPRFASLRGTYGDCSFRVDCAGSDKRYGFNMTYSQSGRLYVFESPIDAMSHASLVNAEAGSTEAWKGQNRLSLAGTSDTALIKYFEMYSGINELVFCLDNDPAGREAAVNLTRKCSGLGFQTRLEFPTLKDYNEDLRDFIQKGKEITMKKAAAKTYNDICV